MAKEVEEICKEIKVNNLNEGDVPKWKLKDAINRHHADEARAEMGKKMKDIKDEEIGKT